jgi:hypothetical protein
LKVFIFVLRKVEGFVFVLGGWRFLYLLLKRLKVLALREVESFALAFECWRFLLFLLNVEGSSSYFWMIKVFIFIFWY